jgi:hypothetical protein
MEKPAEDRNSVSRLKSQAESHVEDKYLYIMRFKHQFNRFAEDKLTEKNRMEQQINKLN